jgi:CDP-diacylglycerol--serine O-phosphatidyltransferase
VGRRASTSGPGTLHPLALLFVLSGSLMISKTLRIPKP